jgi:hypothetical protein
MGTVKTRTWIAAAAVAASWLPSSDAEAGENYGGPELTYVLDVPAVLLSLPPVIANAIYIGGGTRSPVGWRILGYVAGAACIAAGALTVWAFTGASNNQGTGFAVGGGTIAIGAVDVGLSIWGGALPPAVVTPAVMTDVKGRPAVGAGLRILRF